MRAADPDAYLGDTGLGIEREGLRLAQLCGSLSRPRAAYLYLPWLRGARLRAGHSPMVPRIWWRDGEDSARHVFGDFSRVASFHRVHVGNAVSAWVSDREVADLKW